MAGQWLRGEGGGHRLVNPSSGEIVACCSTAGVDFSKAMKLARNPGGPALRALIFADRSALLAKIADLLASRRARWFEIDRINSGNTKADSSTSRRTDPHYFGHPHHETGGESESG